MKYFLMAILIALLSCKTQKITNDLKYKADIEQKHDSVGSTITIDKGDVKSSINVELKEDINETIKTKTTELSKPDAFGFQYPTKITETETKKETKKDSKVNEKKEDNKNIKTEQKGKQSDELTDNSKLKDDVETEDTTNNWLYVAAPLLICGVFALIIYLLKRFSIY